MQHDILRYKLQQISREHPPLLSSHSCVTCHHQLWLSRVSGSIITAFRLCSRDPPLIYSLLSSKDSPRFKQTSDPHFSASQFITSLQQKYNTCRAQSLLYAIKQASMQVTENTQNKQQGLFIAAVPCWDVALDHQARNRQLQDQKTLGQV